MQPPIGAATASQRRIAAFPVALAAQGLPGQSCGHRSFLMTLTFGAALVVETWTAHCLPDPHLCREHRVWTKYGMLRLCPCLNRLLRLRRQRNLRRAWGPKRLPT